MVVKNIVKKCVSTFLFIVCGLCIMDIAVAGSHREMFLVSHIDTYPRTVENAEQRLEDFFWTGSGDGPPAPAERSTPTPVQPSIIIKTTTVLATVYLDSSDIADPVTDSTNGDCILNCEGPLAPPGGLDPSRPEGQGGIASIPADRRYWLLTVIRGGTPDALQLKLARLYQKAFVRQQEKHLGIVKTLDAASPRRKHDVQSFITKKSHNNTHLTPIFLPETEFALKYSGSDRSLQMLSANSIQSSMSNYEGTKKEKFTETHERAATETLKSIVISSQFINEKNSEVNFTNVTYYSNVIIPTNVVKNNLGLNIIPTKTIIRREVVTDRNEVSEEEEDDQLMMESLETPEFSEESSNSSILYKRQVISPEQQPPVHVHIHNITEFPATQDVEIVYSVFVGGRAVPAAVAARDMRLVHEREVARELGFPVTTKAEPYLKTAEPLNGVERASPSHDLWIIIGGAIAAILLLILILLLVCRIARKKKTASSAALNSYRNQLLAQVERRGLSQDDEKDGKLISVVSPSRTRPSSTILPVYRADSTSSTSSGSGLSDIASTLKHRQSRLEHQIQHARRARHKKIRQKRVGTTDSLLVSAGVSPDSDSTDSSRTNRTVMPSAPTAPATPSSYLSMPSLKSFPRGNAVEPLSRVLEPISVRHLDVDSPIHTAKSETKSKRPKSNYRRDQVTPTERATPTPVAPQRKQMSSQLVRMGSMDKDPGVIGPLVWDLHCQRIKDHPKQKTIEEMKKEETAKKEIVQCISGQGNVQNISRMRQRFNELVDDAFSLFGSPGSSPKSRNHSNDTYNIPEERVHKDKIQREDTSYDNQGYVSLEQDNEPNLIQARNDNVMLPGSPHSALATVRGWTPTSRPNTSVTFSQTISAEGGRPRTSLPRQPALKEAREPPVRAWDAPTQQPRPVSANYPRTPQVKPAYIMADGQLQAGDPALPLISAIKSEIQRVKQSHLPS